MRCDCCRKIGPSPRLEDFKVDENSRMVVALKAAAAKIEKMKNRKFNKK
jgi:hypothetical protein